MKVSLDEWLRTGCLGDLRHAMSEADVVALLGPPDAVGGTSRKYPQPSVLLYGTVELWFRQQRPHELTGIWWEAGEKGLFRLTPACEVVDWAFTPDWTFSLVDAYLREHGLTYKRQDMPSSDETMRLVLPARVTITFQNERLYGVMG